MKIEKRANKKYPLKITCSNGKKLIIPRQQEFSNDWLRHHGCSLVAEYIALQWIGCGRKHYPIHLLRWHKKNTPRECPPRYAKVTLRGVDTGIDKIGKNKGKGVYHAVPTQSAMVKALDNGNLIILEQKNPIHSVVLIPDKDAGKGKCYMASNGKVTKVTIASRAKKATTNKKYRGMIVVKEI